MGQIKQKVERHTVDIINTLNERARAVFRGIMLPLQWERFLKVGSTAV